jgi:tetratricopeptide (TPR) repeat protein
VARGTQHRKRRPPANARVAAQPAAAAHAKKRSGHPTWEQQLFFGKLRTKVKPIFLLLAIVFAGTFVFLGVGSGSTGISDILQNWFNGSSASSASLSKLQKATVDHPKSAAAWLAYANALESKHQDDNAISALTQYTTLKPKDQNALLELASLYLSRATDWNTLYTNLEAQSSALAPTPLLTPKSTSQLGKALSAQSTPFATAVSAESGGAVSNAYSKVIGYLSSRTDTYKKLAALTPKDATTQYELAQAAQESGDTATAIAATKAFLKLAPSDSQAPAARKALKQLEAQQKASAATTQTTTTPTKTAKAKSKKKKSS